MWLTGATHKGFKSPFAMGKIISFSLSGIFGIILLFGAFVAFSLLPISGNYSLMTCLSGSMEPTLLIGSVVVVKPFQEYQVGDIITFKKPGQDTPTTHRIVEKEFENGLVQFVVKGDANEDPDSEPVKKEEVLGKVLFSIPYLGYLAQFARTKFGFVLLVSLPAAVIIFGEVLKIKKEIERLRRKKRGEKVETNL